MIGDFFAIALNNLKRRKLRSWLTMIGIFIGIAAVVALMSLGQGLENAIIGQFATLSTDKLTIQNAGTGFGPPGSTVVEKLNDHDMDIIGGVRGVEAVVSRLVRNGKIEYNDAASFNYIADIPEDAEQMDIVYESMDLKTEKGRLLKKGDNRKILIGSNIAKGEIFDKKIEVGKKIIIQGEEFEVIGILKKAGSFQVNSVIMMLKRDMEDLLEIEGEIDLIIAQIAKGEDIEEVAGRIEKALRKDRGLKEGEEDFSVVTPLESLEAFQAILNVVQMVVIGIAAISLIVGGIGIANTMYTSVLERKKEIGTMKAIGAKNSNVLMIFLFESGLLGLVGGVIGVLLGMGVAILVSAGGNAALGTNLIQADISTLRMIALVTFSFLLGVLFGAVPSYQASKLRPVEALRG